MSHKHRWTAAGKSVIKGFENKETKICKCGAIMFEKFLKEKGLEDGEKDVGKMV